MPPGRGRAPGALGLSALLVAVPLALAAPLVGGCTFERRPDTLNGEERPDTGAVSGGATARDSVEGTVDAFVEVLRAGDVSRAVGMLHEQGTLYDEETGRRWNLALGDSVLPRPVERDGRELQPSESWVEIYDEAALVVRHYDTTVSPGEAPRTAVETYVLVRVDGRWTIRHLHRSRGPDPES